MLHDNMGPPHSIYMTGVIGLGPLPGQAHELTEYAQAPEIQTMYVLNLPISALRTKMRQEFERHRYVKQLQTVDVLLFHSHAEFQVCPISRVFPPTSPGLGSAFSVRCVGWRRG